MEAKILMKQVNRIRLIKIKKKLVFYLLYIYMYMYIVESYLKIVYLDKFQKHRGNC